MNVFWPKLLPRTACSVSTRCIYPQMMMFDDAQKGTQKFTDRSWTPGFCLWSPPAPTTKKQQIVRVFAYQKHHETDCSRRNCQSGLIQIAGLTRWLGRTYVYEGSNQMEGDILIFRGNPD